MPAKRCSNCSTNWPNQAKYADCPICEVETWFSNSETSLTAQQAEQLIDKHREEYKRLEDQDALLDYHFNKWFCEEVGIVNPFGPDGRVAKRSDGAPLCELL